VHRFVLLRIPERVLRLLAGELSELFLISQRVVPRRIAQTGFQFAHPKLPQALKDILSTPRHAQPCAAAVACELVPFGLTEADLRRRLFVLNANGELCSGIDAAIVLWGTLPGYRRLATLMSLPGLHQFAAMVYDLIVAPQLTRWSAHTVRVRSMRGIL
jgi:hypothetical protein